MKKTIKTQLVIFSCVLLLSVVLCQIIFSVFLSKRYYTGLKIKEAEKLFYELKNNYSDESSTILNIIRRAENTHNIRVQISSSTESIYGLNINIRSFGSDMFDSARERLYSTEPKAAVLKIPELPQMANIPANLPGLPQMNMENIILSGRFEYNGANRYVRITTPVEAIDASVSVITRVNTIIAVVVMLIGIAASFIFAKIFSRPVQNIQAVAQNTALLNFDVRADENLSTVELRDLSGSINAMSDKLKSLISDLRSSNEKLQADVDHQKRLDKMRREFVANVSHELKTPLHLLLMYSENLKNNIDGIDKNYYCGTIIEETNRLNEMVKSLLDLSAIENGLEKMNMEEFDLSDLSKNIVSKMSPMFEGIALHVNLEQGIIIEGDANYFEQAIKNFMVNAVSHTPSGGQIDIDLKQNGNQVLFSVFNEGSGIAEEDMPQIWESFYQTDKARTQTGEGHSGLGLYVVKTIVQAHRGEYGVRNTENGVVFWFSVAGRWE